MTHTINKNDTVIFDIDDTMGFFTSSFDEWLSETLGVEIADRNLHTSYHLLGPYLDHLPETVTAIEVLKEFEATGKMADPDHFKPTSVVTLAKKLQGEGVNTLALTAREWMQDGHKTTTDWLHALGINMPVFVLGLKDSKAAWINQKISDERSKFRGSWDNQPKVWLFEDNPTHIKEVSWSCLHVETPIVVDHPHNRDLSPSFKRVDPHSTDWITNDKTA